MLIPTIDKFSSRTAGIRCMWRLLSGELPEVTEEQKRWAAAQLSAALNVGAGEPRSGEPLFITNRITERRAS